MFKTNDIIQKNQLVLHVQQKVSKKKIVNHLFCAVQSINNSKQNNCFRQSFHTDLENVTNTVNNLTNTATLTVE